MKVSIIIPNLNGEGWLGECLKTCINQDFKEEYEIIVIDNNSTDSSIDIITDVMKDFKNFHLIQNDKNTGFSYAVNQGIRLSKAEYVAMFNNDAFAKEDWLSQLVNTIQESDDIFSVASLMIQHYDRQLCDDAGDYVPIFGWTCKRGDGLSFKRYQKKERIFSACGGAALYRKSILDKIGLFDEAFFAYGEDVDLGWRANNLGYKNIYQPKAICYHICSATTGGRYNAFKAEKSGQNTALLLYKNMPLLMFLINLPFILIGFIPKYLMFLKNGYSKELIKGTLNAFKLKDTVIKPPFSFKYIKNYIWVELMMIKGVFVYVDYRLKRFLKIK